MTLMLVFGIGVIVELALVSLPVLWSMRRMLGFIPIVLIGFWIGFNLSTISSLLTFSLVLIAVFRLLNLFKLAKINIHHKYLANVTRRTSYVLAGLSLVILLLAQSTSPFTTSEAINILAVSQFAVALLTLAVTSKNLQKTKHHLAKHFYSDKELPTVTVAIPARNETDDLASCVRTVLANDYPKLEVLVLDDCSQDRTAEIIRDFAHDGVRFIKGNPPEDRWLAKNQAYEKLAQHASGEIILYCGVDVRFGPQAIRSLVSSMLTKDRLMMSVLPFRIGGGVNTSLIQPLRYWWELALPRRLFNRPPVLSTCWLINRKYLKKLGYFNGVSHNILPEGFFAREAVKSDKYAFIRADEHLDVKTVKSVEEQFQTAIRVKYPLIRKRPEHTLLLVFGEFVFLLLPIVFAASWFFTGISITSIFGLIASIMLVSTHYLIMSASHPFHSTLAIFNYPFAIITEIVMTIVSMYKYEFGIVDWKGRNVCVPAMHVIKRLPRI